jgi:hypothetical protein
MNNLEYKILDGSENYGSSGSFGIKIMVGGSHLPTNLHTTAINGVVYDALNRIEHEVRAAAIAEDPKSAQEAAKEKSDLLSLFPCHIYAEPIKNGYWGNAYHSRHLPWYIVTTTIGRFTIGWRKRVIEIEWKGTVGTKTSAELFAGEDVTKETHLIHAWGYGKAREYINAIFTGVPVKAPVTA